VHTRIFTLSCACAAAGAAGKRCAENAAEAAQHIGCTKGELMKSHVEWAGCTVEELQRMDATEIQRLAGVANGTAKDVTGSNVRLWCKCALCQQW